MWKVLAVVMWLGATAWAAPAKGPHGATQLAIQYTYTSFHHAQHSYVIVWNGTGYVAGKRAIDAKLVEGLYAALTDLRASDHDLQCVSHTDDYPEFVLSVDGDEPITLHSTSNCHGFVPWNIRINGKLHVQFTGAAGRALMALLAAADPDTWQHPDSPDATTMFGDEYVGLDTFSGTRPAGSAAAACASALEGDARLRKAFGQTIHVSELGLGCDLRTSADCKTTVADAKFVWEGVDTELELGCSGGTIDASDAALANVGELRKVLESKPVRLLVKMSSDRPRMWNAHGWRIEGYYLLPSFDFTLGRATLSARAVGEKGPGGGAYWKALGLDAKKLTKKEAADFYETTATLDFDGHIAK